MEKFPSHAREEVEKGAEGRKRGKKGGKGRGEDEERPRRCASPLFLSSRRNSLPSLERERERRARVFYALTLFFFFLIFYFF